MAAGTMPERTISHKETPEHPPALPEADTPTEQGGAGEADAGCITAEVGSGSVRPGLHRRAALADPAGGGRRQDERGADGE